MARLLSGMFGFQFWISHRIAFKKQKNVADWIALHPKKEDLTDRIEEHPWIALHPKKEERLAETNLAYRIEEHPKKQRPNANAKAKGKVKNDALKNNK